VDTHKAIYNTLIEKMAQVGDDYLNPPPVFETMHGEFLHLDMEAGSLKAKFPVLEAYLNPFGSMQGGMIAAAVDNVIGPLSFLLAHPNVTRHLELKFSQQITPDVVSILVIGKLLERDENILKLKATVRDSNGVLLARARASHWIIGS
jgi:acyl-coenzyme A thioesterase PaaI-like protein